MKNYLYIIPIAFICVFSSCDFLDRDPLAEGSESSFWKNEKDAEVGLNALYPLLPDSRDFWRDCHSDNSLMTNAWGESGMGYIGLGSHVPGSRYLLEEWKYDHIYRILYYLERLRELESIKPEIKERFEGEARFILALRYYRMTRLFGDMPLVKESPVSLADSYMPRSPKAEVLEYVIENIDKAILYLPERQLGANTGRITKAAALTLKADIYMDMASYAKFHRGEDAKSLWETAAKAAQEVVNLNLYKLENDYAYIFTYEANNNNTEVILSRQYMINELFHMLPVLASPAGVGATGEGWASFCPTRDLVDSYECTDGLTIYESPAYDKKNPWNNRDTRLKKTFMLPGADVHRPNGTKSPYMPHPAYAQPEQMQREGGGITGFMYLKYNDMETSKPTQSSINFCLYRYSEILLILAEALNEYDPTNTKISWAMNQVRARTGLPTVDHLLGNYTKMREKIREERRHEFVAEHKRYFDILRWKIAEDVLSKAGYGINVDEKQPVGDYTVDQFLGQKRTFDATKHYLWPVPQTARDRNSKLTQNPNW